MATIKREGKFVSVPMSAVMKECDEMHEALEKGKEEFIKAFRQNIRTSAVRSFADSHLETALHAFYGDFILEFLRELKIIP